MSEEKKYTVIDRRGEEKFEEERETPKVEAASTPASSTTSTTVVYGTSMWHDRVLVLPDPENHRQQNGVWLAGEDDMRTGTVTSVGPGRFDVRGTKVPMTAKIGQRVLYGKWAGAPITVGGTDMRVMRDGEIFCEIFEE